jgi:colanic acid biosynthesis protein WcaH
MLRGTNVMVPREESDLKPTVLFDQIVRWTPIVSVEAIIVIDNSLLLLKRKNQPAKGQWWFACGRIRKDESLKETLHRG